MCGMETWRKWKPMIFELLFIGLFFIYLCMYNNIKYLVAICNCRVRAFSYSKMMTTALLNDDKAYMTRCN